ncbi:MAG TPA: chorismate synthase [Anaerolineales bacterium]|nr:chorismate synthase [Anaerolineales bacterium]
MSLRFLTAGESHGPALAAILDGVPAGLPLDVSVLDKELERRQVGYGAGPRMKIEKDRARILSGVMAGETIGAPIAILVENTDHEKWKGKPVRPMTAPRPGHADLTGAVKYGYKDLRPALERASARETAARVAVGAICKHFLAQFGIKVGGYVREIGGVAVVGLDELPYLRRFELAEESDVRCPDPASAGKMRTRIEETIHAKDTLGGLLEIVALDAPVGLGSHVQWDRRLDSRLGAAVLSVQAIKGVEIGEAFENSRRTGTQAQDAIRLNSGGDLGRATDRSGGIEGGISNGQPIIIRAAMKPIATTLTPQGTVDLASGEESFTRYERSDFCPVPRAVPILEAMVAFVLAGALIEKLGGDSLGEMHPRFDLLRKARLEDLRMANEERVWWPE